jgi:hypothetical protein
VSKIVLKFPHEVIFRTRNYGTLLLAFLVLRNGLLKISVDLVSCRNSRVSIPFLLAKWKVEIFSSNQGSRKVHVEKSSIAFSSRSVLITFKSSESSREVNPGSTEAFCYASLCCYRGRKAMYTEFFSHSSPHHGQFLDRWTSSSSVSRSYDTVTPLRHRFSQTVLTTLRPHGLTIVELRVAYTRYPDG